MAFLEGITKVFPVSPSIYPGQKLVNPFGVNNTGGIMIRPYECFYPPDYTRWPVYLTTVSVPYIVLKSMIKTSTHQ